MTPGILNNTSRCIYRVLATSVFLVAAACDTSNTPTQTGTVLGDPVLMEADLSNDALIAPAVPDLSITYQEQQLVFSWQAERDITSVSLFAFDTTTQIETLISDQISPSTNNASLPFIALHTAIDDWQYRIELCTPNDCVSSYRTSISVPLAPSLVELNSNRTVANWQPYLNHTGNVMVAVSHDAQNAEIHFKLSTGWVYASSITPAGLGNGDDSVVDVAMSASGDTVAVAVYQPQNNQIDISVFDRLGEGWFETSQWQTAYIANAEQSPDRLIAMANNAEALLVLGENSISRYVRLGFEYQLHSTQTSNSRIQGWDASPNLDELVWIDNTRGDRLALHRLTLVDDSYTHSIITQGLPAISAVGANIQVNTLGHAILLAGWQINEDQQSLPTLWHADITTDSIKVLSVKTGAVIDLPFEPLILGSSDDLKTSFISWGNGSQQRTQLYHIDAQRLTRSFTLHEAVSLNQQSYAFALSGDGTRFSWASSDVHTLD